MQGLTQFHCGRFNFLIQYCQRVGIRPPRVVLTEHGMDDLSDIKAWSSGLNVTPGYLNVRGWKSLTQQWEDWYGGRGWSPQRAYFEQLKWADNVIYRNSIVEGQCIFSWGHSSGMWEQFDIEPAEELQDLLVGYAGEPSPPAPLPQGEGSEEPTEEKPPIVVEPPPPTLPTEETPPPARPGEGSEEADPEPFKGSLTIEIAERTQEELDVVLAYLKAVMQKEYRFIELMRVMGRNGVDAAGD